MNDNFMKSTFAVLRKSYFDLNFDVTQTWCPAGPGGNLNSEAEVSAGALLAAASQPKQMTDVDAASLARSRTSREELFRTGPSAT
ncbi:hypothetical protein GWI33_003253 [Rhynchophorus ferrugineus]|uniref:Uncharacterized protein n=1 Tax=Rhynchophorus ferrugineus TaxID=354439 RepID=A0A834INT2_RHYFE|nr:hypothetical protein GWI33_003253 [Rhynchophorus ferrugineus]